MLKIFISVFIVFSISVYSPAQTLRTAADTVTAADGLKYIIISKGSGVKADTGKEVEVNYNWYLTNGKLIGSSIKTGRPFDFVLGKGNVIKGWDEGISLMHAGDHYVFIIPPQLGYGAKGSGRVIPPNATLIYDTYLLNVSDAREQFIDTLFNLTLEKGIDTAIALYKNLYRTERDKYNFKEDQLKILGFKLLLKERRDEAIDVFKLNIAMHPESPDVFNSLGEAYLKYGQNAPALENFKKALAIDPANAVAKYEINKLNGAK